MKFLMFLLKIPVAVMGLCLGVILGVAAAFLLNTGLSSCRPNQFCMGEPYIVFLVLLIACPVLGIVFAILACRLVGRLSDRHAIAIAMGALICLVIVVGGNYVTSHPFLSRSLVAPVSLYIAALALATTRAHFRAANKSDHGISSN